MFFRTCHRQGDSTPRLFRCLGLGWWPLSTSNVETLEVSQCVFLEQIGNTRKKQTYYCTSKTQSKSSKKQLYYRLSWILRKNTCRGTDCILKQPFTIIEPSFFFFIMTTIPAWKSTPTTLSLACGFQAAARGIAFKEWTYYLENTHQLTWPWCCVRFFFNFQSREVMNGKNHKRVFCFFWYPPNNRIPFHFRGFWIKVVGCFMFHHGVIKWHQFFWGGSKVDANLFMVILRDFPLINGA